MENTKTYSTEELLDRIDQLESTLSIMHHNMTMLNDSLKDTQKYLVGVATNQNMIAKRIALWPYIPVAKDEEE